MHEGQPEDEAERKHCAREAGSDHGFTFELLLEQRAAARAPLLEQLRIKDMLLDDLRTVNAVMVKARDALHARVKELESQFVTTRGDAAHWMAKHDEMRDQVAELEARVSAATELKGR